MTRADEPSCPFCQLNDPEVTVYADALIQPVVSRAPINRYHVIIVPRAHVERFPEVPPATTAAVLAVAQRVGRAIALAAARRLLLTFADIFRPQPDVRGGSGLTREACAR